MIRGTLKEKLYFGSEFLESRWKQPKANHWIIVSGSSLFQNTSATRTTLVRHNCYTNDASATRVKHFHYDNDTSENIFSHPYISYMVNERLQSQRQFSSKNYLLQMPCSHAKIHLKSAPQRLNSVIGKATSKRQTLDCIWKCLWTFPHNYAQ